MNVQTPADQQVSFLIVTSRLKLRVLRPQDAPALLAYRNDPHIARYQSWELPYTPAAAGALIAEMADKVPGNPGWVQIGLERAGTSELIGDVALNTQGQQAEIGVTLSKAAQNQGYATEGLRALMEYAFGTLELEQVVAEIDPRNLAVARLLGRLGFGYRETQVGTYLHRGEWTDNAVYVLPQHGRFKG